MWSSSSNYPMQTDNSCRKLHLEFFTHLKLLHLAWVSQNCHGMSLAGPSHANIEGCPRTVLGLSCDVPCGILWKPSHTNFQGHPRTVLGCPIWDPPDTKSHQSSGTSQDCPGMSHVGSSGHQVTSILDVPGQSWDVPHGIVRTSSYFNLEGCPRTLLGCPSWDCLDIKSLQLKGMSQDTPGMSLIGSFWHHVIPACMDVPWDVWNLGLP